MIIGLKANVREIAECYRTAYPNARVLYASEKDFAASGRVRFFNDIRNNDWDCIIMSHDQFGKIPQSPELQQRILQAECSSVYCRRSWIQWRKIWKCCARRARTCRVRC